MSVMPTDESDTNAFSLVFELRATDSSVTNFTSNICPSGAIQI